LTPERLAERLSDITNRADETVPLSGSAQGGNEIAKAMENAGQR
jgi:hypothetical protein